jgi:hypothetical protein
MIAMAGPGTHDRHNFPEVVASGPCYGHNFREVVPGYGSAIISVIRSGGPGRA